MQRILPFVPPIARKPTVGIAAISCSRCMSTNAGAEKPTLKIPLANDLGGISIPAFQKQKDRQSKGGSWNLSNRLLARDRHQPAGSQTEPPQQAPNTVRNIIEKKTRGSVARDDSSLSQSRVLNDPRSKDAQVSRRENDNRRRQHREEQALSGDSSTPRGHFPNNGRAHGENNNRPRQQREGETRTGPPTSQQQQTRRPNRSNPHAQQVVRASKELVASAQAPKERKKPSNPIRARVKDDGMLNSAYVGPRKLLQPAVPPLTDLKAIMQPFTLSSPARFNNTSQIKYQVFQGPPVSISEHGSPQEVVQMAKLALSHDGNIRLRSRRTAIEVVKKFANQSAEEESRRTSQLVIPVQQAAVRAYA